MNNIKTNAPANSTQTTSTSTKVRLRTNVQAGGLTLGCQKQPDGYPPPSSCSL